MIKKLIPQTIRGKIIIVTAAMTLIITMITVCICFSVFQSFLLKNQIQSTEFSLQVVSNNISADMKDLVYFSKWCCSNSSLMDYLEAFNGKNRMPLASDDPGQLRPLALSAYNRLKEEYLKYFNTRSNEYMSRVIISALNENNFLQMLTSSGNSSAYAAKTVANCEFFDTLYESDSFTWIGLTDDPISKANPAQIIPIVRPVYNEFRSEIIGWTYVEISSSLFSNYLSTYPLADDSRLFLTIGEHSYRLTDGRWVETKLPEAASDVNLQNGITSDPGTKAKTVITDDGTRRIMVERPIEDIEGGSRWTLSQVLSIQQLQNQRKVYVLLIFAICAVIFSLGTLLTFLLNRMIGQPINGLCRKIDVISCGDFTRDETIEWPHELGKIGRGINHMSENIVGLMDKRVADEKQKKDLEYQILQSQINPHFLYNTLNSIKWMATIQQAAGIADMTTALARLLKNVSKGSASLITLGEELELVKDYFLIQQYRYGGSITIDYRIASDDLLSCRLHRFTLQPIIENALFHGIEPKGTAGHITVEAKAVPDACGDGYDLQLSVTDDGVGMSGDMIIQALQPDAAGKNQADFFKQVGISNVNQRIRYDFGPSYGITIHSEPGRFTTMTILLPIHQEDGKGIHS